MFFFVDASLRHRIDKSKALYTFDKVLISIRSDVTYIYLAVGSNQIIQKNISLRASCFRMPTLDQNRSNIGKTEWIKVTKTV